MIQLVSSILFLLLGIFIGLRLQKDVINEETKQLSKRVKDKVTPSEVGSIEAPSAEYLRKRETGEAEIEEEFRRTIKLD